MSQTALDDRIKARERELVALENRVAHDTNKMQELQKQSTVLQADIDKKRTEYELFMGGRDAETKKLRNDLVADREKFESEKTEFVKILQDLNGQRQRLEADKQAFANEKSVVEQTRENLRQCITAIQRAITLISL